MEYFYIIVYFCLNLLLEHSTKNSQRLNNYLSFIDSQNLTNILTEYVDPTSYQGWYNNIAKLFEINIFKDNKEKKTILLNVLKNTFFIPSIFATLNHKVFSAQQITNIQTILNSNIWQSLSVDEKLNFVLSLDQEYLKQLLEQLPLQDITILTNTNKTVVSDIIRDINVERYKLIEQKKLQTQKFESDVTILKTTETALRNQILAEQKSAYDSMIQPDLDHKSKQKAEELKKQQQIKEDSINKDQKDKLITTDLQNITQQDKDYLSGLISTNQTEVINLLTQNPNLLLCKFDANNTILHECIRLISQKNETQILALIEHIIKSSSSDICNETNNIGISPLIMAINKKNLNMVNKLLDLNADPTKPWQQKTPLQLADEKKYNDIKKSLEAAIKKQLQTQEKTTDLLNRESKKIEEAQNKQRQALASEMTQELKQLQSAFDTHKEKIKQIEKNKHKLDSEITETKKAVIKKEQIKFEELTKEFNKIKREITAKTEKQQEALRKKELQKKKEEDSKDPFFPITRTAYSVTEDSYVKHMQGLHEEFTGLEPTIPRNNSQLELEELVASINGLSSNDSDLSTPTRDSSSPTSNTSMEPEWELLNLLAGNAVDEFRSFFEKHPNIVINYRDTNGNSFLHLAAQSGHLEMTKMLLEKKIFTQPNLANKQGATPLHLAAECKRANVVKVLIEAKADVNAKTRNNNTPVYVAALVAKDPEIVKILLDHGADPTFKYTPPTKKSSIVGQLIAPAKKTIPELLLTKMNTDLANKQALTDIRQQFAKAMQKPPTKTPVIISGKKGTKT